MKRSRKVEIYGDLDVVVKKLLEYKARNEDVYCVFNGRVLKALETTEDSAYLKITGFTKDEFVRRVNESRRRWQEQKKKEAEEAKQKKWHEWHEEYEREELERKVREDGYRMMVDKQRGPNGNIITKEKVIAGLKFIAENRYIEQNELIQGLIDLGCTFTLEDVIEQFPGDELLSEGIRRGKLSCGASVICNVRDSEYGRSFADDRFLSIDDDTSIYHFIRVVTGDESYTKESISQGGPKF